MGVEYIEFSALFDAVELIAGHAIYSLLLRRRRTKGTVGANAFQINTMAGFGRIIAADR